MLVDPNTNPLTGTGDTPDADFELDLSDLADDPSSDATATAAVPPTPTASDVG